jgi:hypothetical protein
MLKCGMQCMHCNSVSSQLVIKLCISHGMGLNGTLAEAKLCPRKYGKSALAFGNAFCCLTRNTACLLLPLECSNYSYCDPWKCSKYCHPWKCSKYSYCRPWKCSNIPSVTPRKAANIPTVTPGNAANITSVTPGNAADIRVQDIACRDQIRAGLRSPKSRNSSLVPFHPPNPPHPPLPHPVPSPPTGPIRRSSNIELLIIETRQNWQDRDRRLYCTCKLHFWAPVVT